MSLETATTAPAETAEQLVVVIEQLLGELHPGKHRGLMISLDSALDAELGLDSLARVELLARLERHFRVALPQTVFAEAETPRDLLRAITGARGRAVAMPRMQVTPHAKPVSQQLPTQAVTLVEVLAWHVQQHPQQLHLRILNDALEADTLTYQQVWQGAQQVAIGLQQLGVQPGAAVAIMLPTSREYFFSFYGILLAGAIPVPIYPPVRRSQLAEHLQRHHGILNNCKASLLITIPEAKVIAHLLKSQVESMQHVMCVGELTAQGGTYIRPAIGANDIAFLQYTSGSTGSPKGVLLTHANLLANIRVMGEVVDAAANDVFVSWLPLYHDMGLIGAWLGSLYFMVELVVMSPLTFITRPQNWLWAIHQYRGTLSASPNFGYELCLQRIREEDVAGLDLSSWRLAFNGAEQVSPATIRQFSTQFKPAGFKPESMLPVYGLAESCVGLAFPRLNQLPRIDCVAREVFTQSSEARVIGAGAANRLCFVGCGQPLPGHQVRIVDEDGRELPERRAGFLEFRGPSATSGYYHNPAATKQLYDGDWLVSGDMAYIADGDIFITGRSKDIIIRAGRNIYPHELEQAVGNLPGIRKGCVVAFGATDAHARTERLVVVAESHATDAASQRTLQQKIMTTATDLIGLPPDDVRIVPPHTVLKTSSGKIRRSACRELYEQGRLEQVQRALWRQFGTILLESIIPSWRRFRRRIAAQLYAAYAWSLFGVLGVAAFGAVMVLPTLRARWAVVRGLLKLLAWAAVTPIEAQGLHNLPPEIQPCIYVANHASYIDALVLIAALPHSISFVAKVELRKKAVVRWLLQRLQVEFVERFDRQQVLIDAKRLADKVQQRHSLLFFAEGTFTRIPGLQEFHMGAFVTAVQANIGVIPIALHGTRSVLRSDTWFPRHGHVTITVGKLLAPRAARVAGESAIWQAAIELRDQSREQILQHCGEPDLSQQHFPT